MFREEICLCLFFRLPDFCGFFRTAEYHLERVKIPVKIVRRFLGYDLGNNSRCIGVVELRLRLSLESGIRMLDGDHSRHSVSNIRTGKITVLLLEDPQLSRVAVHYLGEGSLESGQMRSAVRVKNIVTVSLHIFMKLIDILKCDLDLNSFIFSFEGDRLCQTL